MIRERKHRLPLELYIGAIRITFTLCIKNKGKLFVSKNVVDKFNEILQQVLEIQKIKNWVYVYMPEHLHIILEGMNKNSNLWKAVKLFKQKTGYWLSKNFDSLVAAGFSLRSKPKWQKDFYDHIHRKDEDLKKHIKYILENPVRAGLVQKWEDYPFKGSLDYEIFEIIK